MVEEHFVGQPQGNTCEGRFKLLSSIMIFVFIPDHVREKEREIVRKRGIQI